MRVALASVTRDTHRFRRAVWVLLSVALLLRLTAVWGVPADRLIPSWAASSTDAIVYDELATALVAGKGYVDSAGNVAYRPPGYPFFLAGVYAVFGDAPRTTRTVQALAGTLTVALLMRIAFLLWMSRSAVLITGSIAGVYPFFLYYVPLFLTETLFSFLGVGSLWAALEAFRVERVRWIVAAGALCALAALTRPTMLPFALTGSLCIAWLLRSRRAGIAMLATAVILIAPWTIRNYLRTGMFVPISTNASLNLRKANVSEYEGVPAELLAPESSASREVIESRANLRAFLDHVREEPIDYGLACLQRAVRFWSPWPLGQPRAVQWLGLVTFAPLLLAAPVALRRLWRSQRREAWLLIAFTGTFYAVHILSIVHIRFRVPVVDPVMILLAAGMLASRLPRRG